MVESLRKSAAPPGPRWAGGRASGPQVSCHLCSITEPLLEPGMNGVVLVTRAALTKNAGLCGADRGSTPSSPEAGPTMEGAGRVGVCRGSTPVRTDAASHCVLVWPFLRARHLGLASSGFPLAKVLFCRIRKDPILMTAFNLHHLPKGPPSPNTVTGG